MAKKLINTTVKLGKGTLLNEAVSEHPQFATRTVAKQIKTAPNGIRIESMGNIPVVQGFTPIGVFPKNSGFGDAYLTSYSIYNGLIMCQTYSTYGAELSSRFECVVFYVKT